MKVVGFIGNEATTFAQQVVGCSESVKATIEKMIEDGELVIDETSTPQDFDDIVRNGYVDARPLDELMQKAEVFNITNPHFEELKYTPSLNISKHRNRRNHNQQSKRKAAKAARKQNRKNR